MPARPRKTAAAAAKPDFAKLLGAAKRPEKLVKICLRGDLAAEHEAAEEELRQAEKTAGDSLAGNGTGEIAERIQAIEAEMHASIYPFRLRALPSPRYREFKAAHPIRLDGPEGEANRRDVVFGFNADTGFEPLVRLCLIDPDLADAAFTELMDALTESQFEDLASAAWYLNRGEVDVPFSSAASDLMRNSADE